MCVCVCIQYKSHLACLISIVSVSVHISTPFRSVLLHLFFSGLHISKKFGRSLPTNIFVTSTNIIVISRPNRNEPETVKTHNSL